MVNACFWQEHQSYEFFRCCIVAFGLKGRPHGGFEKVARLMQCDADRLFGINLGAFYHLICKALIAQFLL